MSEKPKRPKSRPTGFPVDPKKVVKVPASEIIDVDRILVWRVKTCYTQERSRWETLRSGTTVEYRPPRSYSGMAPVTIDGEAELVPGKKSVWQNLVNWCRQNNANPEEYIRVAFSSLPMTISAPEPHQLMTPKYLKKWKEVSGTIVETLGRKLLAEKRIASTHFTLRRQMYKEPHAFALRCVLTNADLELSPLFRYCVAIDTNTQETAVISRRFFAEAVLQFECYRDAYTVAWSAALPDGFAKMSGRAYPLVLSRLGLGSAGNE